MTLAACCYLHMSLKFLQEGGILVEPHEGFAQAGGQGQNTRSTGTLTLHELVQLLTVHGKTAFI